MKKSYTFLKAHPKFAYYAGDTAMLNEEAATPLLETGYLKEAKKVLDVKVPHRELLIKAGYESVDDFDDKIAEILSAEQLKDVQEFLSAKVAKKSKK
jgi:hypothetical protein